MSVKLLTEHHLELLSLKRGCISSSESTDVKCQIVVNHMLLLICHLLCQSAVVISWLCFNIMDQDKTAISSGFIMFASMIK